jgi:alpha-1,6-mannosyltransferase
LLLSAGAYLGLAYATPRAQFGQLLVLFGVAGAAYAWLLYSRLPLRWGLAAALLFRLLWLPATPALSDDFYRFRWDGLLTSHGVRAFAYTPRQLLPAPGVQLPPAAASLADATAQLRGLLPHLNSPDYFSVYPPVCQVLYGAAAALFPASQVGFLWVVRSALLLAEVGTALLLLWLLPLAGWPARRALVYLLHPLVVVEVVGNVHMEGVVVFFLLLAGRLLVRRQAGLAGGALALAVATKLLPLLALPLLVRRLGRQGSVWFGAGLMGGVGLLFWPFISWQLLLHIGQSLDLYFQNFQFNASIYYLVRMVSWVVLGPTQIVFVGPQALLMALSAYFALATTVHPWYLVPLVALSCFSRWRYAQVWAGLAVLSYAAYQTVPYTENLVLVACEYAGVLAWLLSETYFRKPLPNTQLAEER